MSSREYQIRGSDGGPPDGRRRRRSSRGATSFPAAGATTRCESACGPRRGIALTFEAEHNVLDLAEGSFTTDVFRMRANTQFSPWISLANNLQYDTVSRLLGWQMRVRWIRRPGNDLYLVYTHNWRERRDVRRSAVRDARQPARDEARVHAAVLTLWLTHNSQLPLASAVS